MELYNYQEKYINSLRVSIKKGNKRIVLCAPTGSGKTVMFTFMVKKHLERGGRVIIFTHRTELLTQAGGTFDEFGLTPELIIAGKEPDLTAPLHIAMVETFNRRKMEYSAFMQQKTLIIFDEAHLQNFTKIMEDVPTSAVSIGATATPYRPPKQIQMSEFYTDLIQEMDTQDVINEGKLTPAKSFGIDIDMSGLKKKANDYDTSQYYEENKIYKGVVNNWERTSKNKKTILFASNIQSSKEVCQEFISKGYNAKHIDGKTSKNDRTNILEWFDKTNDAIICNCGILTAGFDQKDIHTVILYRATTSLPLFLQMCGRGSRIHPGKEYFNILDFGNNIARHGFWEDRRQWELSYKKKKDKQQEAPIKICPKCEAINRASAKECECCGFVFPIPEPTEEEVILKELKKVELKGQKISMLSIDDLIILQRAKKFKSAFIWRVIRSRGKNTLSIYAKTMGYSDGWVFRQIQEIEQGNIKFTDLTVM